MLGPLMSIAVFAAILALFYYWFIRRPGVGYRKAFDKFLEEERESNFARKRDVPAEFYFSPDKAELPFRDYGGLPEGAALAGAAREAEAAFARRMMRFPSKKTNLELKQLYGLANLDAIAAMEGNYDVLLIKLFRWASELDKAGLRDEAAAVLEKSVEYGTDISGVYTLLADIYFERGDKDGLNGLVELLKAADFILSKKTEIYARGKLLDL